MLGDINLVLILLAGLAVMSSPGPATLAIADTSISLGRRHGLALASGITLGSIIWSVAAALGLGALMASHVWAFEVLRYIGAIYLLFLAVKSAKSALKPSTVFKAEPVCLNLKQAFAKGLALHLTNPKAILFFGSLYAIGLPHGASPMALLIVVCALGGLAALLFHGYALVFSSAPMVAVYVRMRCGFEAVFAIAFGGAAFKIFTTRLG